MEEKKSFLNNEKGSILVVAVIFLFLLTGLGIFSTTTANIELQISGNHKVNKMVFYAADSGIHYVAVNPALYGPDNLDTSNPKNFPGPGSTDTYPLTSKLNVGGTVTYQGITQLAAGSGNSAGIVLAIHYQLLSTSTGPNNGTNTVQAGFYRKGMGGL
jgi:hypothetical protein